MSGSIKQGLASVRLKFLAPRWENNTHNGVYEALILQQRMVK